MALAGVAALALGGCVDLTAVTNFAKESSAIAANKAALDDTAAQQAAFDFRQRHPDIADAAVANDPAQGEFNSERAATAKALDALNAYMTVLARLSAKDETSVEPDIQGIETGLQGLHVTDPKVKAGLEAASALTNLLLQAKVQHDLNLLVTRADAPVRTITAYLADAADTAKTTYNLNGSLLRSYWRDVATTHCPPATRACDAVGELAAHDLATDAATWDAKARAADAANRAFTQIGRDHGELARHAGHLDAKDLAALLKNDEPLLLSAIQNLRAL